MPDDDLRMLGDPSEHEVRALMMGQFVDGVEHVADRGAGDTVTIEFAEGGKVTLSSEGRIRLAWNGPMPDGHTQVIRVHPVELHEDQIEKDAQAGSPYTVGEYGAVHSIKMEKLRWPLWVEVLRHPVQWFRGWRS